MNVARTIILFALLGATIAAATTLDAADQPAKPNVKTLLQVPLAEEFTPGREILIDLVDIPPNTSLDRHWHPGEEFHYYLEGEAQIQIEGEPPIVGTPGTVGHVPFQKRHMARAGEKGAKVLVFRVHTKGEPWRYLAPEDADKK